MEETLYRTWCKTCSDFKLHRSELGKDTWTCMDCKTDYTSIKISEIPKEKIAIQRERYKRKKSEEFNAVFGMMSLGLLTERPIGYTSIQESDAGLKREREIRKEIEERERQKKLDFIASKKGLSRNDICNCGSGLKFKKCCLSKMN